MCSYAIMSLTVYSLVRRKKPCISRQQSMRQQSSMGSSMPHLIYTLTREVKDAFGRLCVRKHQGTDVLRLKTVAIYVQLNTSIFAFRF